MDSPIRQQLKRNDYQRHKLFRKMKRRLKAKREQEKELAEKELRRKLRMPKYKDGKEGYPNLKKIVLGDDILPLYERYIKDGMTPEQSLSSMRRFYDMYMRDSDVDYESFYEGELPAVTIKPDYNKKYDVKLVTHYPSLEWPIGHSEILTPGGNIISADFDDKSYNFLLNNCSDATILALSLAFGTTLGWHWINTPGTAKSFAEKKLNGKTEKDYSDDVYQYGEGRIKNAMKGADITHIPATMKLLQTLANFAHKLYSTGEYADGKPAYTYTKPLSGVGVDEEGNLRDPEVPSAKGSVLLPEVTVTTRDPRKYVSAFNGNLKYLDDMIGFVPIAGDLNDAANAGIAAYKGDYLLAGMLGAGLLLPNILEKPLKYTLKFGGKGLLKLGSKLGVADYVWNDLADEGLKAVWDAKRNGYYAFTNRGHEKLGRKIWNNKFVGRVNDIIDRANNLEKQQFNKRMYGQYSDRFTNAPAYMYVGKPDVVGIAQHEVGKDAVLRASNDTKSPNFVLYDPRMIRKNADFRVDPEPVSVWFDTNVQKQDLDYGGKYSDSKKQITIPMHTKANSGFLNKHLTEPDKVFDWLIGHEYTHHLQNLPQFALNLRLSVDGGNWTSYYTAMPNDYVFGQYLNPFHAIYDRSNNRLNEAMSSEKAGFKKEIDPNLEMTDYGKYGEHNASPDEAVADLRAFQVAGYSDEDIYDYMFREYGMSADDVDLARAMGYKHGKAPGIRIKPENRGKFTALKKRTGHSASWFKEHGTPALKKMATFALNARKWKH